MANVGIPKISESALAEGDMSEQRKNTAFLQALGAQGMPLNLDAWDGYPANRDRIAQMLADKNANTVALAGDTHNAWAFNLRDSKQRAIGVEGYARHKQSRHGVTYRYRLTNWLRH